ncbi:unnamed protein product [Didymodactylos carnosus]|uniref:Uncharacterized protein n=1 Tax=Didymodactylos carnosus TaxID=1234261 RepID=A0A8S2FDU5_9BILA|nr:unnamed protein product [Didymodactylos carnosus]CAF4232946.1 unnamed protein product [Didymodactylos carnosus]
MHNPVQRQSRSQPEHKEQSQLQSVRRAYQSQCIQPQIGHSTQPTQRQEEQKQQDKKKKRKINTEVLKYRKRGMNDEEILQLINNPNQTIKTTTTPRPIANNNNSITPIEDMEITTTRTTTDIATTHKCKRMPISSSTLSLSKQQPLPKKTKPNILMPNKRNNRLPAYLRSPSKTEQHFIYKRLRLLGRQYRLNLHQTIWQSYLTLGSEQQLWPIQETTTFIRQLTQLINKLNYFELQIEQLNYYHHLGVAESIWTGLKPKQSEISAAKLIWRATNDEQTLRYEIAIFKNWFNSKLNNKCCYTFEQLQLTNIKNILKTLIPNQKQIDIQLSKDFNQQILIIAAQKAEIYAKKVQHYKDKLYQRTHHIQPCHHNVITVIENRQQNMVQRDQ